MNADFEYRHPSPDLDIEESLDFPPETNPLANRTGVLATDRFEMLSAYLDGELSPDQRKQVESWLDTDSSVKRLYTQLLRMRDAIKAIPVPEFESSTSEELAKQVFARVDRQPRVLVLWGAVGAAIAATCVAAVSGLVVGDRAFFPQTASSPYPSSQVAFSPAPDLSASSLMIELDRPVVEIPQATLVDWNGSSSN